MSKVCFSAKLERADNKVLKNYFRRDTLIALLFAAMLIVGSLSFVLVPPLLKDVVSQLAAAIIILFIIIVSPVCIVMRLAKLNADLEKKEMQQMFDDHASGRL
jgi:uncharacterized membrane protein